jgi:mannose-6-phosphate isomerase-like protein (cupin superfamily)
LRLLVLGVDADGHSCVVDDTEAIPSAVDGVPGTNVARLFATSESPPPPCAPGLGRLDQGLAPGLVTWYVVEHDPPASPEQHSAANELHHRNAIDLVVVLEGSGDMMLDDGPHPVSAGDCIVMAGVDHRLRTGPDGCRLMSFAIGAASPPELVDDTEA